MSDASAQEHAIQSPAPAAAEPAVHTLDWLRQVIDQAPVALAVKDVHGYYVLANTLAANLFDLSPEAIVGQTDDDLRGAVAAYRSYGSEQEVLATHTQIQAIDTIQRAGHEYTLLTVHAPLYDHSSTISGVYTLALDITDLVQQMRIATLPKAPDLPDCPAWQLAQCTNQLLRCSDPSAVYEVMARFLPQIFPQTSGALYMGSDNHTMFERVAAWHTGLAHPGSNVCVPASCPCVRRKQLHLVMDSATGDACCQHPTAPTRLTTLCVPLSQQNTIIGVLHVNHTGPGRLYTFQVRVLEELAEQVMLVLGNLAHQHALAAHTIRDPLTSLFNQRYLYETLEREFYRAARHNEPLSLIALEIDDFGLLLARHGEAACHELLRTVAGFLQTYIRLEDVACRHSQARFTLVLMGASLEVTCQRAEALRHALRQVKVQYYGQKLPPIRVSLGVVCFPQHSQSAPMLLRMADHACERARKYGGNRVVVGPEHP